MIAARGTLLCVMARLILVVACLLPLGGCASSARSGTASPASPESNGNGSAGEERPLSFVTTAQLETLAAGMPYGVRWSEIVSSPGCFFFSGPGALGRDQQLGESATFAIGEGRASLDFGSGVVFAGPRTGDRITLARRATHDFSGKWVTAETITLELAPAGGWIGRYHYDEHAPSDPTPGTCHIDASVLVGM